MPKETIGKSGSALKSAAEKAVGLAVKAANKDGIWNDHAATLAITIAPPYWKT